MNKRTAVQVIDLLTVAEARLSEAVALVHVSTSEDEARQFSRQIGAALAVLVVDIKRGMLYSQYPELAPSDPDETEHREMLERVRQRSAEIAARYPPGGST